MGFWSKLFRRNQKIAVEQDQTPLSMASRLKKHGHNEEAEAMRRFALALGEVHVLSNVALPRLPDNWTTLTSIAFLVLCAAKRRYSNKFDDLIVTEEVNQITSESTTITRPCAQLASSWYRQVEALGVTTHFPVAWLEHATIVSSLGPRYFRDRLLPTLQRLAEAEDAVNNGVVTVCGSLLDVMDA